MCQHCLMHQSALRLRWVRSRLLSCRRSPTRRPPRQAHMVTNNSRVRLSLHRLVDRRQELAPLPALRRRDHRKVQASEVDHRLDPHLHLELAVRLACEVHRRLTLVRSLLCRACPMCQCPVPAKVVHQAPMRPSKLDHSNQCIRSSSSSVVHSRQALTAQCPVNSKVDRLIQQAWCLVHHHQALHRWACQAWLVRLQAHRSTAPRHREPVLVLRRDHRLPVAVDLRLRRSSSTLQVTVLTFLSHSASSFRYCRASWHASRPQRHRLRSE